MTWNRFFYGSESPAESKRILYNILGGSLLICWYGVKTEFVVSDWWLRWGSIATVLLSIAVAPVFCRLCLQALGSASDARHEKWMLYSASYVMLLIIVWITVVRTLPDLSTRWTAPMRTLQAEFQTRREFSRSSCDYQIIGPLLRFHPLGYACISASEFERLPAQGPMRIEGAQSMFGIHIKHVTSAGNLLGPTLETNAAQQ